MPRKSAKTAPTPAGEQTAPPADNVSERELVAMLLKPAAGAEPTASPSATDTSAQPSPEPAAEPEASHEPPPTEQPESEPPPSEPPATEGAIGEQEESAPEAAESTDEPDGEQQPSREFEYPKFQKRVDALTAKLRAAEATIEQLRATAQPPKTEATTPQAPKPIAIPAPELGEFDERLQQAQQVIEWAEGNRDGADDVPIAEGKTVSFTAEQVRQLKARAMNDLARLHAERQVKAAEIHRARLAKLNADIAAASSAYPWLKDQASAEFAQGRAILESNPTLINDPDVIWIVAGAVEARKAKANGSATTTRSKAQPKPTPVVTKPAGQAPSRNGADGVRKQLVEAQKRAEESGSINDYQRVLVLETRLKELARH